MTLARLSTIFVCVVSVVSGTFLSPRNASVACNNSPDLCSRPYSNITHLGAHDSPFTANSSTNSFSISEAGNQNVNSIAQLNAGVRLLTAQVHNNNGAWHLCHSSCQLLDAGLLRDWLKEIKGWLDTNPNEVVTILLVNSDNASPSDLAAEYQAADIGSYGYIPSSAPMTNWPTLQEMITNNTRLVSFVTPLNSASTTVAPYLLSEFEYLFENSYNVTSPSAFTCEADRPSSVKGQTTSAVQAGLLPLMNHFLYTTGSFGIQMPDTDSINNTNGLTGVGSLGQAASACTAAYGRKPAFVLVDYFDQGSTLQVVDDLNGVTASSREKVSSPTGGGVTSFSNDGARAKSSTFTTVVLILALGMFW